MATEEDLLEMGFTACTITARKLDIPHEDPYGRGPFCRLVASGPLSDAPGVYAWVVDSQVMDIGETGRLRVMVQGQKLGRAYDDYTYVPPSQVKRPHDPRVRVNGLINKAIGAGSTVSWWWLETPS